MYYILLAAKQWCNKLISVFVHRASRFGVPIFIGVFRGDILGFLRGVDILGLLRMQVVSVFVICRL